MIIFASFSFTLMNVFIKLTSGVSVSEKIIVRNLFVMGFSLFVIIKNKINLFKIDGKLWLFFRCLFGAVAIYLNYFVLSKLMLADASIIQKLSAIFTVLASAVILKEKLTKRVVLLILLAFVGVIFVAKPSFSGFFGTDMPYYLLAVLGAFFAGLAYMCLRPLGSRMNPNAIIFYFSLFTILVLLPSYVGNIRPIEGSNLLFLVLSGATATMGQYGISIAYKFAPSKEISIYDYSSVIFAGILGIFIFSDVPDAGSIFGYALIFIAALLMREKKKNK